MSLRYHVVAPNLRDEVQPGDHISWLVLTRTGYSRHHAIFVCWKTHNVAEVIHVTGDNEGHWISSTRDRLGPLGNGDQEHAVGMIPAQVCKELLDLGRYVEQGNLFLHEYDSKRCYRNCEAEQRAKDRIGEFQYDAENHNCEHFVRECKINSEMNEAYNRLEKEEWNAKKKKFIKFGLLVSAVGLLVAFGMVYGGQK